MPAAGKPSMVVAAPQQRAPPPVDVMLLGWLRAKAMRAALWLQNQIVDGERQKMEPWCRPKDQLTQETIEAERRHSHCANLLNTISVGPSGIGGKQGVTYHGRRP